MKEFLEKLFSSNFMPHGHCYLWDPGLIWLHVVSDSLIALAYFSIPIALIYFIQRRRDLPFHWVFVCFGIFILACGATHAMEVWTLWHANYWLSGAIKAVTAMASVPTAILLFQSVPQALALPSPEALRFEIAERKRTEQALHQAKDDLELTVLERTAELRKANEDLLAEIAQRKQADEALRRSRDELEMKVQERTAELSKLNEELRSVNEDLEAFAYSISHDLRAPVRHIAGFAEFLQERAGPVLDAKSKHHIDVILESTNRMGNMVDDLLAFSRIGRAETQKTSVNLEELVKSVIDEIAPDTASRKIKWRIDHLPSCYGDSSMLRLVFSNLLSNAVKFTRTREQAEIEVDSLSHSPNEIVVFVKDNGVGFDMKYKDKLFGVFQRLHSQKAFEGTGIGLATVQRIVHRHGGRVWAEGSINNGATFYVALPKPEKVSV